MDLKTYFYSLDAAAREDFASKAGTSIGYLIQVANGNKRLELGFADVLHVLSCGAVSLDDLPLTPNAIRQRSIREQVARPHVEPSV